MTQAQKILRDLKRGKRITPMDALRNYSCMRLAARIYDLRFQGHNIKDRMKPVKNGKAVAEYRLAKA